MTEPEKKSYLFIINDSPYGNERPYNALRLALNLVKRPDARVRVFLIGDGINCAIAGQKNARGLLQRRTHVEVAGEARRGGNLRDVRKGSRARA